MTVGRPFRDQDYLALKAAQRRLNEECGGQEAAAAVTRVSHQHLSRYGAQRDPSFTPADVIADLEADAGVPYITRVLAEMNGHMVIAKPRPDADPRWLSHLSAISKECGEAVARIAQAIDNGGVITAEEIKGLRLRGEIAEAMRALAELDASLEIVERGEAS